MTNLSESRPLERVNSREATGLKGEGRDSPSAVPKYPEYKGSGIEWLPCTDRIERMIEEMAV